MSNPLSITTVAENVEARGVVRFDDECILIPGPQPRSRMTKLLAKPSSFIFKRKPSPQDPHPHSPISPRDYDAPQSPSSPRSAKSSLNESKPPSPYIQRRSSLPPSSRAHHTRASPSSAPTTPLVTIPLRPCCPNCYPATENAALQGDNWIENFTRPARRRRSLSTDNRPCPPHLPASTSGATIQWSTRAESAPPSSSTFRSVVVDEIDGKVATHTNDVVSGSDGQGRQGTVTEVRNGLDRLSVRDPEDNVLPPLLSRQKPQMHKPWMSPIPSNNPSVDDLSPTDAVSEDVDSSSPASDSISPSISPPSSPMLPTPTSSAMPTPTSSPTMSQRERETSPRMPGSFRVPKGALLRAGSDILKGVSMLGSSPV
ncbi:hypothetical protein F5888DRAFT_1905950 [Russula emetica]|nr:hypothetical protein F5888DRAFT_1905950 [Russula emetica]